MTNRRVSNEIDHAQRVFVRVVGLLTGHAKPSPSLAPLVEDAQRAVERQEKQDPQARQQAEVWQAQHLKAEAAELAVQKARDIAAREERAARAMREALAQDSRDSYLLEARQARESAGARLSDCQKAIAGHFKALGSQWDARPQDRKGLAEWALDAHANDLLERGVVLGENMEPTLVNVPLTRWAARLRQRLAVALKVDGDAQVRAKFLGLMKQERGVTAVRELGHMAAQRDFDRALDTHPKLLAQLARLESANKSFKQATAQARMDKDAVETPAQRTAMAAWVRKMTSLPEVAALAKAISPLESGMPSAPAYSGRTAELTRHAKKSLYDHASRQASDSSPVQDNSLFMNFLLWHMATAPEGTPLTSSAQGQMLQAWSQEIELRAADMPGGGGFTTGGGFGGESHGHGGHHTPDSGGYTAPSSYPSHSEDSGRSSSYDSPSPPSDHSSSYDSSSSSSSSFD